MVAAVPRSLLLPLAAFAVLAPGAAPAAAAGAGEPWVRYRCAAAKEFTVSRTAEVATVRSAEGTLRLARGSSSMGQLYGSPAATLIIDGDFAALVWKGASRFRDCFAAPRLAASG
jgi:hypothetical protein